jgi:hypothetical protein
MNLNIYGSRHFGFQVLLTLLYFNFVLPVFFLFFYSEPELGARINPGMTLTPFASSYPHIIIAMENVKEVWISLTAKYFRQKFY